MQQWYVLFSKPRKESQVCEQLLQRGLQAYLPLMPKSLGAQRRKQLPLFPRYLFARLDLGRVSPDTIKWVPGLVGLVTFGEEPAAVDDAVVVHIERRLAQMQQQKLAPFQPGQRVILRAGHPLSALDVVFERALSGGKRAQILINLLGRLTRCEVERSCLEAVGSP